MAASKVIEQTTADPVDEGRAALMAGDRARAQTLLQLAVRDDPDNIDAWLWLSGTQCEPDQIAYCLHQVLARDPSHPQAIEGLAWLAETAGRQPAEALAGVTPAPPGDGLESAPSQADAPAHSGSTSGRGARYPTSIRQAEATGSAALAESALHVFSVGALFGLLRLTTTLRPGTLLLLRGREGTIGLPAAVAIALVAATLHGLALLIVWSILSRNLSRARNAQRGDHFDSFVRMGRVFIPGYAVSAALLLAAGALGWSEQRWLPVALAIWVTLLASAALIARRMLRLFDLVRVSTRRRATEVARIIVAPLIAAVLGLGLAGIVVQALLRGI